MNDAAKRLLTYAMLGASTAPRCDCDDCTSGDDQWCCRRCHEIARGGGA